MMEGCRKVRRQTLRSVAAVRGTVLGFLFHSKYGPLSHKIQPSMYLLDSVPSGILILDFPFTS
jgi:hypothetical protein